MPVRQGGAKLALALTVALALVGISPALRAQNADPSEKGPTASETVSASSASVGGMLMFDTTVGWNFTPHLGVDVGIPYLLDTRPGLFEGTAGRIGYTNYPYVGCTFFFGCYYGTATSSRLFAGELADGYVEAHYTGNYNRYNFFTNVTGDLPTASYRKGLTTGRLQWDWFNHVDTNFHGFDPFVNFGLANGRMDQHFLPRPFESDLPFRTFGYMADFEGGLQYKVWRRFTIGASMWDVLPFGPQRIYSNLVWAFPGANNELTVGGTGTGLAGPVGVGGTGVGGTGTGGAGGGSVIGAKGRILIFPYPPTGTAGTFGYVAGDPNHGRYWNQEFETVGPAYIDRDNGYSATLGFSPWKYMDVEIGYNHSVRYALDTWMVTLEFNANGLFRKLTNY